MLSGSLDAFALPDVFTLLAMTKKTGVLSIVTGRTDGRVDFRDGEIAYAVSDTRRMALASRLLGGGLVDEEQLRHVVAAQRGGAAALSRVLHDDGLLSPELFDTFVREQIQDAVFELMRLEEGSFSFTAEPDDEAEDVVRVRVPSDQLVAEGARRLEEWAQIKSHVVSHAAVVTLAPRPATESVTVSMEPAQWQLLTFVDGRRTVRDLVDLTGRGEYATCQVIAGLAEQGLVEVVDPSAGVRTGVSELVARHELLRRLEERELGAVGRAGAAPRAPRAVPLPPQADAPSENPSRAPAEPSIAATAAEGAAEPQRGGHPAAAERPPAGGGSSALAGSDDGAEGAGGEPVGEPVLELVDARRPDDDAAGRPGRGGQRRSEARPRLADQPRPHDHSDDLTPPDGVPALGRGGRAAPLAVVDDTHEEPPASVFDAPPEAEGVVVDVVEVTSVAEVTELRPGQPTAPEQPNGTGQPDRAAGQDPEPAQGRTKEEEDAFDRAEVERELAALGFRTANRAPDDDDGQPGNPFRVSRPEENGRGGLLSRLMDGRKPS